MSYDDSTGIVTLQINQIGPGDEGEYTCSAKNQYGEGLLIDTHSFNFRIERVEVERQMNKTIKGKSNVIMHFSLSGEAICSVYIQPEGFGPPTQQLQDSYKKEFSLQSNEQKMQTGGQMFQQRSYQQTIDKRSYVNGTSTSIEDFKV